MFVYYWLSLLYVVVGYCVILVCGGLLFVVVVCVLLVVLFDARCSLLAVVVFVVRFWCFVCGRCLFGGYL